MKLNKFNNLQIFFIPLWFMFANQIKHIQAERTNIGMLAIIYGKNEKKLCIKICIWNKIKIYYTLQIK